MSSPPASEQLRLSTADFDAYLPERASSNAFTQPRAELKARMLAWAPGVVARLAEIGVPVQVTASDEQPSLRNGRRVDWQRVLFWRDAASRAQIERAADRKRSLAAALEDPAPHQKHPYLALRIDSQKLEVSVELHPEAWVDTKNLHARLADPGRTLELTSAIEALPEQFTVGLGGDGTSRARPGGGQQQTEADRTPAARATSDSIRELLDRAEQEQRPFWVGWTIPRDVAVTHSELLDDQLEDAIVALGPIEKLVAWAPDNELFDLAREVEVAKADRAKADDEAERDRAWQTKRERTEEEIRARISERRSDRATAGTSQEPSEPSPSAEPPASPSRPLPPLAVPRILRRVALATEVDPNAPIEKGTRVQVLAGPFRGKLGVVQELDGKGAARVRLGLLATRVDVKDLMAAAEGKDRPALASSHRKPIGARS